VDSSHAKAMAIIPEENPRHGPVATMATTPLSPKKQAEVEDLARWEIGVASFFYPRGKSESLLFSTAGEWVRLFLGAGHGTAALDEAGGVVDSCRTAEAEQAARTVIPISLEEGRRIECRDEGWIIVDTSAGWSFEIERCMLSSGEPVVFDTPAVALTAFLRARNREEGRKRRHHEAMNRLGRPLQGPSQYEKESSLAN
jgi:hypothetical protein